MSGREKRGHNTDYREASVGKSARILPISEERQGFVIVTFKAQLVAKGTAGASRAGSGDQVGTKSRLEGTREPDIMWIADPERFLSHEVAEVVCDSLSADALTRPMQVREDPPPYGGHE